MWLGQCGWGSAGGAVCVDSKTNLPQSQCCYPNSTIVSRFFFHGNFSCKCHSSCTNRQTEIYAISLACNMDMTFYIFAELRRGCKFGPKSTPEGPGGPPGESWEGPGRRRDPPRDPPDAPLPQDLAEAPEPQGLPFRGPFFEFSELFF